MLGCQLVWIMHVFPQTPVPPFALLMLGGRVQMHPVYGKPCGTILPQHAV